MMSDCQTSEAISVPEAANGSEPAPKGRLLLNLVHMSGRFHNNKDGSTAVEFAFVAAPFFAIMFAVFEVAFSFFGELMLESGLQGAARLIRTGQAQQQGFSEVEFKNSVCAGMHGLLDCNANLTVDVKSFDEFNNIVIPPPLNAQGELSGGFGYSPGVQGSVVVARAFYEWSLLTPKLGSIGLDNMKSGDRLLVSTTTFRNEPFGN